MQTPENYDLNDTTKGRAHRCVELTPASAGYSNWREDGNTQLSQSKTAGILPRRSPIHRLRSAADWDRNRLAGVGFSAAAGDGTVVGSAAAERTGRKCHSGGSSMVYANSAPLAHIAQGTVFYHDFQPGTYCLTVRLYGTPANLVDTVQLGPGTQAYVQVQAVPNWEMGSTAGGASFAVLTMSPQEAQAYMRDMRDLGQR